MEQESFERYLSKIRGLKDSSVAHYRESMRKISHILHDLGYDDYDTLYEIDSYPELRRIENLLKNNKGFIELDKQGHQMYSAGLHRYMEFAQGKGFSDCDDALALIDHPVEVALPANVHDGYRYNRDRIIVHQVLESEHFLCEANSSHQTFLSEKYHKPFMEGHHLIPLSMQKEFNTSLDVYANIVSLCPNCHRMLHFGMKDDQDKVLLHLYDERKDRLADSGIHIGRQEFLEMTERRSLPFSR